MRVFISICIVLTFLGLGESSLRRYTGGRLNNNDPCTVGSGKGNLGKGFNGKGTRRSSGRDCEPGPTPIPTDTMMPSRSSAPSTIPSGFSYPTASPGPTMTFSPTNATYGKGYSNDGDDTDDVDDTDDSPSSKGNSGKGADIARGRRHRELIEVFEESPRRGHPHQARGSLRNQGSSKSQTPGSTPTLARKRVVGGTSSLRLHGTAPAASSSLLDHPIIQDLRSVETRYYMYDDCDILKCDLLEALRKSGPPTNKELDHIATDTRAEADALMALEKHPLRTDDPSQADLFIVPLPISELIAYGCQWEDCQWFQESFDALFNHTIFKEHHGNDHVLISQHWVAFNSRFPTQFPAMNTIYRKLRNVTVAMHYDPYGCAKLAQEPERTHGSGFSSLFQWEGQILTRSFSIGLLGTTEMPFRTLSTEKFDNSEFLLFYHSRILPLAFRSTKFRVALLSNSTDLSALPKSSVGFDIPKAEWIAHFTSSKFCLAVRGDTPHSHTMLHALRAGCVPIVVSDFYEDYAPSFKSVLSLKDWAIFIDEDDFLADPVGQITALSELPRTFLEEKIANATLAQAIILSESPYFVPAFLRESIRASKLPAPMEKSVDAHQRKSSISIGGKVYPYRFPTSLVGVVNLFHEAPIVVGVLSSPEHCARREMIRASWGRDRRVFFLVSGHWDDISDEFHTFGDILWIDLSKAKSLGPSSMKTIQSSVFAHALELHVESYSYMALTSDANYVDMDKMELILRLHRPHYWSRCVHDEDDDVVMPSELGHVFSRKVNHCAVLKAGEGDIDDLIHFPGQAVGVLAKLCNATCEDFGWDYGTEWANVITKVDAGRQFFFLNERLLWNKQMSPYYEGIATDEEEGNAISA